LEGQSTSLKPTRKPVFGWLVSAGLSKKSLNPSVQVNLPIGFRLFFYPLRGCDGCAIGLPRLLTASARGGTTVPAPQRDPARFFRRKNGAAQTHPVPKRQPTSNANAGSLLLS